MCSRLSLWASGLTRDDIYWRSATSGGRATFRTRQKRSQQALPELLNQTGDISAIDPLGKPLIDAFFIECKSLADLHLRTLIYGGVGETRKYWEEPLKKARSYKKELITVAKENFGKEELVLTTKTGWEILRQARKPNRAFRVRALFPDLGLYIFFLRDFLTALDYQKLVHVLESRKTS